MASTSARGTATPATAYLTQRRIAFTVHRYEHDPRASSYGLEAAQALAVDPRRVLKTLVVDVDGALAVAVVPVDTKLDLKAVAGALGGKRATMADATRAARTTGYVVGGISPVGQKRRLPTVVDSAAASAETVLVSAGRRGLEIELTPSDLVAATVAVTAPIARR